MSNKQSATEHEPIATKKKWTLVLLTVSKNASKWNASGKTMD
jgi:hypothetical protein